MNRFLIFVTRSPFDALNGLTALSFCEAAVEAGHEILQVFFYQQGVQHGNVLIQPTSGEQSQLVKWVAFSKKSKIPLNVCVTAAVKRGVVSLNDSSTKEGQENIHPMFNAVGMSEYFTALNAASLNNQVPVKCIQF